MYNKTNKTKLKDIVLFDLINYFEESICNYNYIYLLENGDKIKIDFNLDQIPHLLGLHYLKSSLKGILAIEKIKKKELVLKNLRKSHKEKFKGEIKERIEFFPCIETILNNAQLVEFNPLKVKPFSKIEANYMLYSEELELFLLLGVKTINEQNENIKVCTPVTFLIDREKRFYKNQNQSKILQFEKIKK